MSNIEKIRQEIERRKKICEGIFERESDTYYQGKAVAYGELLAFIDSLPEEKPSEDLEEVAARYEQENRQSILSSVDIVDAFIAGAEWQKEQMMKDAVEGKVFMSFAPGHNQMVMADVDLPTNTKVKLIIVKQDD